jgi:hypothetical protein
MKITQLHQKQKTSDMYACLFLMTKQYHFKNNIHFPTVAQSVWWQPTSWMIKEFGFDIFQFVSYWCRYMCSLNHSNQFAVSHLSSKFRTLCVHFIVLEMFFNVKRLKWVMGVAKNFKGDKRKIWWLTKMEEHCIPCSETDMYRFC